MECHEGTFSNLFYEKVQIKSQVTSYFQENEILHFYKFIEMWYLVFFCHSVNILTLCSLVSLSFFLLSYSVEQVFFWTRNCARPQTSVYKAGARLSVPLLAYNSQQWLGFKLTGGNCINSLIVKHPNVHLGSFPLF